MGRPKNPEPKDERHSDLVYQDLKDHPKAVGDLTKKELDALNDKREKEYLVALESWEELFAKMLREYKTEEEARKRVPDKPNYSPLVRVKVYNVEHPNDPVSVGYNGEVAHYSPKVPVLMREVEVELLQGLRVPEEVYYRDENEKPKKKIEFHDRFIIQEV